MQALGAYEGGRMLFLGFGTGLGTAMIVDGAIVPMELAHLPYKKGTYEDYVGLRGLERNGKKRWRRDVADVVGRLAVALEAEDLVLGGGNSKHLKELPKGARLCTNADAIKGGYRLWTERPGRSSRGLRSEIVAGVPELLAEVDPQLVVDELVVVDRLAGRRRHRRVGASACLYCRHGPARRRTAAVPGGRGRGGRGRAVGARSRCQAARPATSRRPRI